jgi:hypothetical protein
MSKLVIPNPVTQAPSSITYTFALNSPLETGTPDDTIALLLPTFQFGTLATVVESGCGTTTFTVAKADSGTSTATLTLTAESAILPAYTVCSLSIATGVTTSTNAQDADWSGRTAAVTLNDGAVANIAAVKLTKSTATATLAESTERKGVV